MDQPAVQVWGTLLAASATLLYQRLSSPPPLLWTTTALLGALAAHQGLRAAPWDERLHRVLMRSADLAGNRAGVEATLRHLALVLEVEGDPLRHVHPETAALYARLVGRPSRTG